MIDPSNINALNRLGRCYFESGNFADAQRTYEAVLQIQPENQIARNNLSRVHQALQQHSRQNPASAISQLRAAEERQSREAEALQENEIGRMARDYGLKKLEADELHQLLTEMRPLDFKHSKQISAHIVRHKLGSKYQHISGILRMREAGTEWDFHGGFPPQIYRIICTELGLGRQGTHAEAVGFTPFKEVKDRGNNI